MAIAHVRVELPCYFFRGGGGKRRGSYATVQRSSRKAGSEHFEKTGYGYGSQGEFPNTSRLDTSHFIGLFDV